MDIPRTIAPYRYGAKTDEERYAACRRFFRSLSLRDLRMNRNCLVFYLDDPERFYRMRVHDERIAAMQNDKLRVAYLNAEIVRRIWNGEK